MKNGVILIQRLEAIHNSLDKSMRMNADELSKRSDYTDYQELYISRVTELLKEAIDLEDKIRRLVYGG